MHAMGKAKAQNTQNKLPCPSLTPPFFITFVPVCVIKAVPPCLRRIGGPPHLNLLPPSTAATFSPTAAAMEGEESPSSLCVVSVWVEREGRRCGKCVKQNNDD